MSSLNMHPVRLRDLFFINLIPLAVVGFYIIQIINLLSDITIIDWFDSPILSSPGIKMIGLVFGVITMLGAVFSTLIRRTDIFIALCILNALFLFFVLQSN